jgi:hypothetical protein
VRPTEDQQSFEIEVVRRSGVPPLVSPAVHLAGADVRASVSAALVAAGRDMYVSLSLALALSVHNLPNDLGMAIRWRQRKQDVSL